MSLDMPMRWLAAGVPLSLLLDLAVLPDSRELFAREGRRDLGRSLN